MDKLNFWIELKNRLSSNSPKFFKKLQAIGVWLAGIATVLLTIPALPDIIHDISGYIITGSLVMAAVAKMPVKDPDYPTLDKPKDENI